MALDVEILPLQSEALFGTMVDGIRNEGSSINQIQNGVILELLNTEIDPSSVESHDDEVYVHLISEQMSKIFLLGNSLDLSHLPVSAESFSENFMAENKIAPTQIDNQKVRQKLESNKTGIACDSRQVYKMQIKPENIKAGVNGYLDTAKTIYVISLDSCRKSESKVVLFLSDFSFSLAFLILTNYLKEIMFSFLNNKDMLDLVLFDSVPKGNSFDAMQSVFLTSTSDYFQSFVNWQFEIESNNTVRAYFVQDYKGTTATRFYEQNATLWFKELIRQNVQKDCLSIFSQIESSYKLAVSEYLALFVLIIHLILRFLAVLFMLFKSKKTSPKSAKVYAMWNKLMAYFRQVKVNSLLLVFYYNLSNFLSLSLLSKTVLFGLKGNLITTLRSFMVVYPVFCLFDDIGSNQQSIDNKAKNRNKKNKKFAKKQSAIIFKNKSKILWGNCKILKNKLKNTLKRDRSVKNTNMKNTPQIKHCKELLEPTAKAQVEKTLQSASVIQKSKAA